MHLVENRQEHKEKSMTKALQCIGALFIKVRCWPHDTTHYYSSVGNTRSTVSLAEPYFLNLLGILSCPSLIF